MGVRLFTSLSEALPVGEEAENMASRNILIAAFTVGVGFLLAGALVASLLPRWCPLGVGLMSLGVLGHVPILILGIYNWGTSIGKAAVVVSIVIFGWAGLTVAFYIVTGPQP